MDKKELDYNLACDRIALKKSKQRPSLFGDEIWKFERSLRKLEYYSKKRISPAYIFWRMRYHSLSLKLGFTIPTDCIGAGLQLVHYGSIVISEQCRIGENCRIHSGVNIGATSGEALAPRIGNNVYIGPGAKLIGNIQIGDNVVIGANAVVTHDVPDNVTVGGIPAKIISEQNSDMHVVHATSIYRDGQ